MINKGIMSSDSNEWYTPNYIVAFIESEYGKINIDPCAASTTSIGEVNWVKKSYKEQQKYNNIVILLIPARTDTTYWHWWIFPHYSEIYFLKGRIKFETTEGEGESAPFPSALVVFSPNRNKVIKALDINKQSHTQLTLFQEE